MIRPGSVAAVFRFELHRAASIRGMAWWVALVAFPILLSLTVRSITQRIQNRPPPPRVEVELLGINDDGSIDIQTDDGVVQGDEAIEYVRRLSPNFDPDRGEGRGLKGRRRRGRRGPRPVLVLKVPERVEGNDPRRFMLAQKMGREFRVEVEGDEEEDIAPEESQEDSADGVKPPSPQLVVWGFGLFLLLPVVVSMLGVFLWASPAIASELEGRSWAYIATRPDGPVSVLLGKYLVGVLWGTSAALVSLVCCLVIANVPEEGSFSLFLPLATLIVLGCPAYGAIYSLIGTFIPRRAMVVAVVYSLIFEGVLSFLPAMLGEPALISRVTVSYPLRALLTKWLHLDRIADEDIAQFLVSDSLDWVDIGSVLGITTVALAAAIFVLRNQELSQADESDS